MKKTMAYRRRTRDMPFKAPRSRAALLSVLAVAGIGLAVAGCSGIAPIGPTQAPGPTAVAQATPVGPAPRVILYRLGSPIILQVMRGQPATAAGGCPAGLVAAPPRSPGAAPMPCFSPVGTTVTITTAGISEVSADQQPTPPAGQPAFYGFMVAPLAAQVAAVTALIRQAYNSHGALGVTVDGKLWQATQVPSPFSGQQFQIALQSRDQALQLYHLLVPAA